jgi:hypothetical protein
MCRGLGLLVNYKKIKYLENNCDHSNIEEKNAIDNYCKIEIIRDDTIKQGYRIELDEQIDDTAKRIWIEQDFITPNGKIMDKLLKKIKLWCKQNELVIWKSFAKGCSTYATIKGNNYQSGSTIEGNNYQSGSTIKGNNYQSGSTIEGEFYIGMIKLTKHEKLTNLIEKVSKELHKDSEYSLTLNELIEYVSKKRWSKL